MEQKSLTALVCAFARAYHAKNNTIKVFDDFLAEKVLGQEEMEQISFYMAQGIQFFNPGFSGVKDDALRWIVDNQLAPSPLGRAAFAEESLKIAARIGAGQYIIIAAGYDTFACRQPDWANKLQIFELDHPATSSDKQARLTGVTDALPKNLHFVPLDLTKDNIAEKLSACAFFDKSCISFCSMLGLSYYLGRVEASLSSVRKLYLQPSQIRTCAINAYGSSYHRYSFAKSAVNIHIYLGFGKRIPFQKQVELFIGEASFLASPI